MDEIITVNTDGKSQKFLVIEKVNRLSAAEYLKGKKYFVHPNTNLAFIVREIEDVKFEDIPSEPIRI